MTSVPAYSRGQDNISATKLYVVKLGLDKYFLYNNFNDKLEFFMCRYTNYKYSQEFMSHHFLYNSKYKTLLKFV